MPKNFDFWKKIGDNTAVSGKKSDLARCYRHLFAILGLYLMDYGWAENDATKPILYGAWWH